MQAVSFKPETVDAFKIFYSEHKEVVNLMLKSENIMDLAIAQTILTVAGVLPEGGQLA